jgi:predicted RNase H-like nuclease (RuvC/YqgF family)
MSLRNISKRRIKLATEYNTLIERKGCIVTAFEIAFKTCRGEVWKDSDNCIKLQNEMNEVRASLKLNQVKSRYYKSMYKKVQRLKK